MNRIEILEDDKFRFTSWSEISLLSLPEDDAQTLVSLLEEAGNDLLQQSNRDKIDKGMEIHYKYARLFFKVRETFIEVIHLVHIHAFPLNDNMIYKSIEPLEVGELLSV